MSRQILIIDDQDDILRILERELVKTYHCTVSVATNSVQAFEQLEKNPVELIISDVRIGEENGFNLLKAIRSRYPQIGLMMMTAYRSPGYRQMADELGVAFFIEKPFAISMLAKAVDRFFTQRAATLPPAPTAAAASKNGALEHFSPQDLVQLFCLNGRNVALTLTYSPLHPVGRIYIQRGRVLHAEWGAQKGEESFFSMLLQPGAQLALEDYDKEVAPTISSGWEQLLLEAARRQDESTEVHEVTGSAAPDPAAPAAPAPLKDPFADFWKSATMSPDTKMKVGG